MLDIEYYLAYYPGRIAFFHEPVAHYYGIPILSCDHSATDAYTIKESHPTWPYHQFIADYLAYVWKKQLDMLCLLHREEPKFHVPMYIIPPLMPSLAQFHVAFEYCTKPRTMIHALNDISSDISSKISIERNNTWYFGDYENKHKFGWYVDSVNGGMISFPINVGAVSPPHVGLGYMRSYGDMGTVPVTITQQPTRIDHEAKITTGLHIEITGNSSARVSMSEETPVCLDHLSFERVKSHGIRWNMG